MIRTSFSESGETDTTASRPRRGKRLRRQISGDMESATMIEQLARCMTQMAETQQRQLEILEQREHAEEVPRRRPKETVHLTPYVAGENIEDFLQAFERAMEMHRIPDVEWPEQLLRVLSRKARAAFAEVDPQAEFVDFKEAITPEANRIRFRELKYNSQEDKVTCLLH